MFRKTRWRLTWVNAISFTLCLILFLTVFYLSFGQMLNKIQENVVEDYASNQRPRIFNTFDGPMMPPPNRFPTEVNRQGFYYVITSQLEVLYGEELYEGFYAQLQQELIHTDDKYFKRFEYNGEQLLVLIQPLKAQGKLLGYTAIGQNVTSYEQLMSRVLYLLIALIIVFTIAIGLVSYFLAKRAMKPIQHAYNLQREFVANASHELRTPLTVLTSSIELIENDLSVRSLADDEKINEHIVDMKSEAVYMNDMLNSLLYLAKSDQKQIVLHKQPIDVSDIIVQRVRKISRTAPHLAFSIKVDEACVVNADKILLQELITILLKNAVNYTEEGEVTIVASDHQHEVSLQVSDTGIGIAEHELNNIFERFYRVDKVRSKQGTGLGLAIAKNIVDLHEGFISVSSQLGKGTTFEVNLPKNIKKT